MYPKKIKETVLVKPAGESVSIITLETSLGYYETWIKVYDAKDRLGLEYKKNDETELSKVSAVHEYEADKLTKYGWR